jgi:hypothetical protein
MANTVTQAVLTGTTISGNGNDGVLVQASVPSTLTNATISGNKGNGVEVAESQATTVSGAKFLLTGSTVSTNGFAATPAGRGVVITAAAGKVSALFTNNHISANVLEGVRVLGGAALTEVAFNGNHINGNLTAVATASAAIIGGGVFFVSGPIRLGQFLGNRVFGNGANQVAFTVAQDTTLGNPAAWDLSSGAAGVNAAMTCDPAAAPNYVYCYGANTVAGTLGVAVNPSTIPVKIKGMHWQNANPAPTQDFTSGIMQPTDLTTEPTEGVFLSCTAQAGCADVP